MLRRGLWLKTLTLILVEAGIVFSVVVLGEFNHGKSTFINALLGESVLPVGITPTTAVLTHIAHGARPAATLVFDSGQRKNIEPLTPGALGEWLTVPASR